MARAIPGNAHLCRRLSGDADTIAAMAAPLPGLERRRCFQPGNIQSLRQANPELI